MCVLSAVSLPHNSHVLPTKTNITNIFGRPRITRETGRERKTKIVRIKWPFHHSYSIYVGKTREKAKNRRNCMAKDMKKGLFDFPKSIIHSRIRVCICVSAIHSICVVFE